MTDDDKPTLLPATDEELKDSLSFGLRFVGRKRVHVAARHPSPFRVHTEVSPPAEHF